MKLLPLHIVPHEIFPEIILWEKGDEINRFDTYIFYGVFKNGICVFKRGSYFFKYSIYKVMKWKNEAAKKRKLDLDLETDGYMQFIQDFRKAYREIK